MLSITRLVLLYSSVQFIFLVNSLPAPGILGNRGGDDVYLDVLSTLSKIQSTTSSPASPSQAIQALSSAINSSPKPTDIFGVAENIAKAGLTADNVADAIDFVDGLLEGENSDQNINPKSPEPIAYPRAGLNDAPYSLDEDQLRAAIYIPQEFQYGAKNAPQPIILVPGTGDTGYTTFIGNYIPLLSDSTIGDPVWLNIPGFLLNDAQINAEYVAYAINYVYGISNRREVAIISWSQGGINAQWAYKYWPSTRNRVTDHIAFSPDYHGTVLANLIDQGEPLPPSLLQQEYDSDFITTLRSNGGDSAYVPTTTVYSGLFDEIVEPQQGNKASARLKHANGVAVSNNQVQLVCPSGSPASTFYTHEGTLYNPLGYALMVDALSHEGPGRPSRLDLDSVCADYLTPGLDLTDFLLTENAILIAGITLLKYPNKVFEEPSIKAYA